jgi:nicotinate phosphoribosyltransferase
MSGVLVTDLYEASMALVYLDRGMTEPATFSLFVRDLPRDRGFLVAAGLESVLCFLESLEVGPEDVAGFAAAFGRTEREVGALGGLRFTGDVWAVPEGRVVLAGEPIVEVTAPLPVAQLVETFLLNQVNHQTLLCSKAARVRLAAGGRPVIDFGLRRSQGVEAGMHAARAAAIAGLTATSNVAGALRYGLPATGTMAHSFVEAFEDEREAFRVFAESALGPVTLLVDTYDTSRGVTRAAEVLRAVDADRPVGVRLDSGDLGLLAVRARALLDEAGLSRARVVVSGGLDEFDVHDLVASGAPVDVYAVGTKVATSADAPYLDSAYKLVEYAGRPVMKLSTGKVTHPGAKQVFRHRGVRDVLGTRDEAVPDGAEPLLEPVMRGGRRVAPKVSPAEVVRAARQRLDRDLEALPEQMRRIRGPVPLRPEISSALRQRTDAVVAGLRSATSA